MFKAPEKYRVKKGRLASDKSYGANGAFYIPNAITKGRDLFCIASDGLGWEHVSVHVENRGKERTPYWDEMNFIKDLFWDEEDAVIQIHAPKSEYVNRHENTLHLWRPIGVELHLPDKRMVG